MRYIPFFSQYWISPFNAVLMLTTSLLHLCRCCGSSGFALTKAKEVLSLMVRLSTSLFCKTTTTGNARGSKKAKPMIRKDKPPKVNWMQVCRPHSKYRRRSIMLKKKEEVDSLSHTRWNCKYHIVFAMVFSITHRCVNFTKACFCSMLRYLLRKSPQVICPVTI